MERRCYDEVWEDQKEVVLNGFRAAHPRATAGELCAVRFGFCAAITRLPPDQLQALVGDDASVPQSLDQSYHGEPLPGGRPAATQNA
jgi:hypothetical protein